MIANGTTELEPIIVIPKRVRTPEQFDSTKELYIVGVPIDLELEEPNRVGEFKNILIRAYRDAWPALATSTPNYFRKLDLRGWDIVESSGLTIVDISRYSSAEGKRSASPIQDFILHEIEKSTVPLVLLRPGSPLVGDVPAKRLKDTLYDKAEILDAKSGPDIVGDLAERALKIERLPREHMAGVQVLDLKNVDHLKGKLLLVRSLDPVYKGGDTTYFRLVLDKLVEMGLGESKLYLKGPRTNGEELIVNELRQKIDQYDPAHHFTIALPVQQD